jgi:excisionase family DNA binding protein
MNTALDKINMNTESGYLSRRQVATMLGCHIFTVRRMEKAGRLQPYKLSPTLLRYKREDVEKLIAAGKE